MGDVVVFQGFLDQCIHPPLDVNTVLSHVSHLLINLQPPAEAEEPFLASLCKFYLFWKELTAARASKAKTESSAHGLRSFKQFLMLLLF